MKATYRAALMVAAFVFLLPLSARSEIRGGSIEVSPFAGYNWFQDKQNLKDRPVYGGRIGYNFTPHWGIEGTVEFINSRVKDQTIRGPREGQFAFPADDVDLYFYHVDAVYHFMPEGNSPPSSLQVSGEPTITQGYRPWTWPLSMLAWSEILVNGPYRIEGRSQGLFGY